MSLSNQALAVTGRQLTPVENYTVQVIGDESRENELWRALPAHIRPDRFKRNLVNLLMQRPDMLKYDPRLVYREVSKTAALGLLLDPQLGEAYIVPVWNSDANRKEPQLRIGYRGLMKLARQSGEIKKIYAHEVHENDRIECALGTEKRLVHSPDLYGDRGIIIGYYAVVHYADGETDFEPMTQAQVLAIRDRSDAWKTFKAGRIKSTPWQTDEIEMAKKTVLRRLLKRVPQSPELADAITIENVADDLERVAAPARLVVQSEPPRTIEAALDSFADPDSDPPAETALDSIAEADDNSGGAAPTTSHGSVAAEEQQETAAVASLPVSAAESDATPNSNFNPIESARQRGREAAEAGLPRTIPTELRYKSRLAEKDAFVSGYDEIADALVMVMP